MNRVPGFLSGKVLHEGLNCSVIRARRIDGTPVILKRLRSEHPAPGDVTRLRREYELLRNLDLTGVVKAYGFENQGWSWCLVLEDFEGQSLDRLIRLREWSLSEQLRIAIAAAEALGQLHAHDIIHKDISPANIVWNPTTGGLKLIDLGAATVLSRETLAVRSPSELEGTLAYMSPEQTGRMSRSLDHRTDFYSLGATLYELFTGTMLFASTEPMELVHCHLARRPISPHERVPSIPRQVSDIVMRLLEKAPEARYQSSYGLKADLEHCLDSLQEKGSIDAFPLARLDMNERFLLPQSRYGRDREMAELLRLFEQATTESPGKRPTMILVTGYSGVGKSMLVHELHKPITQRRGHLISGKFEQLQRTTPYSAFVSALRSLVRQLLSEHETDLLVWRKLVLEAVGTHGRVVTEVLPEVELLLGPQPPIAELGPTEAQNRFNRVFGGFIRAFAQPHHPLVIFLDDLQWADPGSLNLIELLLANARPQCLLVIGAYRDHEVGSAHPLVPTLNALERAGVGLPRIPMTPFGLADITRFVADALNRPLAEVEQLAQLVAQKTEGNPLFVTELLKSLYTDGLIDFDPVQGCWKWDVSRIAARSLADNVVDLLLGKLRRLPEATQRAVQLAACIGGGFDVDTLAIALETSQSNAFLQLLPAIQEGFLAATSGLVIAEPNAVDSRLIVRDLKFIHDRVQQAAYNLVGEDERKELHLRIGRQFLASMDTQDPVNSLFQVVDQLNRGWILISNVDERNRLAHFNLEAARRARRALAYAAAESYLDAGIRCLSETCWEDAFALSFALHKELAEAQYLNGKYESSERRCKALLARTGDPTEKAELYTTLISQYTMLARYEEAIEHALEGLALLGVDLPTRGSPEQVQAMFKAELERVQVLLGARSIASLIDAPEMTDPAARAITSLVLKVWPAAYYTSPPLSFLLILKAVSMMLRFGPSSRSADLFSNYGHIVSGLLGEHHTGYEFGKLALAETERFHQPDARCRAAFFFANYISPWCRPLRESEPVNDIAFRAGLEGGELIYTGYILTHQAFIKFYSGRPLDEVALALRDVLDYTRRTQNQIATDAMLALNFAVENLRGLNPSPDEFRTRDLDEPTFLESCRTNRSSMTLCRFWMLKAEVLYLQGEFREALSASMNAEANVQNIMGNFAIAYHYLYQALILAALCPEASAGEVKNHRAKLHAQRERWSRWAAACPEGLAHLHELVSAEVARVDGDMPQAMVLYARSLEGARREGNAQHVALAAELTAKAWLIQGQERSAAACLTEAFHCYRLRGAERKMELLERQYPTLLGRDATESTLSLAPSTLLMKSSERERASNTLDLASVLKASQAISSELVLERLLTRVMNVVLENAGAQKGALILERGGELLAQVDAYVEEGNPQKIVARMLQSTPVSHYPEASEEIIRYVARSRDSVMLDDASSEIRFARSAYIARRKPKSVLCEPLSSHGQLIAILYLENNLATGAFTPGRLVVLRMLSSQMATSIENALLYREIEQRVAERTTELEKRNAELQEAIDHLGATQSQLVHSEKMASLGRLSMGIAHEIKNPLNFVINFANLDADLVAELEQRLQEEPTARLEDVRDIIASLKVNTSKVCEHGQRADGIVRSMLSHAGSGSTERRMEDLNTFVDDFVRLAWHGARAQASSIDVHIHSDYDPSLGLVPMHPQELGRVFVNLISNALDAVNERRGMRDSAYVPAIHVSTHKQGEKAVILIRDNGLGIPQSARERIFEPFFTTKPPGLGTGLGLSLSYDIVVNGHGGALTFESQEGQGAVFKVILPTEGATGPGTRGRT